jgi:hypothetical protein
VAWDLPPKPLPALEAGQIVPSDGPARRIARVVVWVVGIGVLFLLARIVQAARGLAEPVSGRGNGYDTAYATGEVAGYVVGSLLLAALLRWAYLRLRHRRGSVRSPWLIGIAALLLLLNLFGATGTTPAAATSPPAAASGSPTAAPVDPEAPAKRVAAGLQIASPYRLGPAPDEARTALLDPIAAQGARAGYRAGEIMAILDEVGPVGYLVVLDVSMTAGGSDAYLDGFLKGATRQGATARRDVVDGQAVGIATSDDHTLIGWTEPPLIMMVVGFDDASAIELTRATLAP